MTVEENDLHEIRQKFIDSDKYRNKVPDQAEETLAIGQSQIMPHRDEKADEDKPRFHTDRKRAGQP